MSVIDCPDYDYVDDGKCSDCHGTGYESDVFEALAMEKAEEQNLFGKNTLIYVVSQEKISSSKKIPAVCRAFKIEHFNLEAFLKDNGMRFGIIK